MRSVPRQPVIGGIAVALCLSPLALGGCVAAKVAGTAVSATGAAVKTTAAAVRTTGRVTGAAVGGARKLATPASDEDPEKAPREAD